MEAWRIGCSGFAYKDWKGAFYPMDIPQTKWFEYYCTKFNCLELNSTFYSFPRITTLSKWYDRSPEDFSFAVKVPQTITHYRRFKDCKEILDKFYDTLREGMKEKLGPVLFQLPPSIIYSEMMLDKIIEHLQPGFKNVVEFRHASWWNNVVFERLASNSITFAGVSHPKLGSEIISNHSLVYYRLHGVPVMFKSSYDSAFISKIVTDVQKISSNKEVYIFFNNTWGLAGVQNALELQSLIRSS